MSWNPDQYLKFAEPRMRPALDLLSRITLQAPQHVHDLGCGTGSLTRIIAQRWPDAAVCGIDDSAAMLAKAAEQPGRIQWIRQDLARWQAPEPADLIYSNAALHWLPEHPALFAGLMAQLAPGGVLAVQMPRNFRAPSHTAIAETVLDGPWRTLLEPLLAPPPVAEPGQYFDWLDPHAASLDIWETEYLQVLTGRDAVKEWTKGTWLKQFLDALPEPMRNDFEAAYARRVGAAYPPRADGRTLFPFRRLFIVASRG
ncbi:MAG TPA: methyltransferase domain-containing protein [Burkholderiaceae bacterium]|nr:methyltransferase domain-containing protein [Burkholderiaceae bacterium]